MRFFNELCSKIETMRWIVLAQKMDRGFQLPSYRFGPPRKPSPLKFGSPGSPPKPGSPEHFSPPQGSPPQGSPFRVASPPKETSPPKGPSPAYEPIAAAMKSRSRSRSRPPHYATTYGNASRRKTHVTSGRSPSPNRRSLYRELGSDVYKTAEGRRSNSRALTHGALGVERGVVAPLSRGRTLVTRGSFN